MQTRSGTILIVLLVIFTFPFWIGLAGGLFGLIIGGFGVMIGILAAFFGVMIAAVIFPFKLIFGWHHHDWFGIPHFHGNVFLVAFLVILLVLVLRERNKVTK